MDPYEAVRAFHARFACAAADRPQIPDPGTVALRLRLIEEEAAELAEAFSRRDLVAVADAIADLLYVTYGTAVACGIDIRPVFDEVHRANMAKVGGGVREDGKVLKPPGWQPPDVAGALRRQGWEEGGRSP